MKLINNEQKILSSNDDKIILTDHRVSMNVNEWGFTYSIQLFLEDISSIEVKYKSSLILLIVGGLSMVGGLAYGIIENQSNTVAFGFILGILFLLMWWFSRQHIISICSHGGTKLDFSIKGFNAEKVDDFVLKVSQAKAERVRNFNV